MIIWIIAAFLLGALVGVSICTMVTFGPNNDPSKHAPYVEY